MQTGKNIKYLSLSKLQEMGKDREAWRTAVCGVAKSRTWLNDWIITTTAENDESNFLGDSKHHQLYLCKKLSNFFLPSRRRFVVFSQQYFLKLNIRAMNEETVPSLQNLNMWSSHVRLFPLSHKSSSIVKEISGFVVIYGYLWRRQWHPTPMLLPGGSHGRRTLVGHSPWGR